ncbi:ABC transporter substrate-binding protein [Jatrophihabitans fulvus]
MRHRTIRTALAAAVAGLVLAACGSGSDDRDGGGSDEIKVGVLTSLTGTFASSYAQFEDGVKARFGLANAGGGVAGHTLRYVMADDRSAGPETVAAAQKLIQQDDVFGVLTASSSLQAASDYLISSDVPVIGANVGGLDVFTSDKAKGFFDVYGYGKAGTVTTTLGDYFKSVGARKVAVIGYGDSENSERSTRNAAESVKAVGLEVGFLDTTLKAGSTDVGPLVQKIKDSGSNALFAPVVPASGYALVRGLAQAGVRLTSSLLATGYGQSVITDPATRQAAKGVDFQLSFSPVEAATSGTKTMTAAFAKYAGVKGIPNFSQYLGWLTADLFVHGLTLEGADADPQAYYRALRAGTWDGAGLMAPTDFDRIKETKPLEDQDNCTNIVRFDGARFVVQSGGPICGKVVPGVTVR